MVATKSNHDIGNYAITNEQQQWLPLKATATQKAASSQKMLVTAVSE